MLVLTRKKGQEIVIDGDITLTIIAVAGNRVKLGLSAPAEVGIRRKEVCHENDACCTPANSERNLACVPECCFV